MADFDQRPVEINIFRRRADTFPILYRLSDENGDPVNVTGWSFLFTVDPSPEPADDTENDFQRAGVIEDGPNGLVRIGPFDASEVDQVREYFYDLQGIDTSGNIRTVARGQWNLEQDITKD